MTIKATTENVTSLVATKLTGAFPVLDASALTGISVGPQSGASDPTVSTNPSGVGIVYKNTTSGETFICTVATAGANVWLNVGSGFGGYGKSFGGNGPGSVAGYSTGGYNSDAPSHYPRSIDKYLFASGGALTDHGDIGHEARQAGGCSSLTHGYAMGGNGTGNAQQASIAKYSFASANTVSTHGTVMSPLVGNIGSCSSTTDGYLTGGSATTSRIQIMSFASNTTMVAHSQLTVARYVDGGGVSSNTHGYTAGGNTHPAQAIGGPIDRFAFDSKSNATDHGDLTGNVIRYGAGGHSSATHGFYSGGHGGPATGYLKGINKYAYASNVTAAAHGDLTHGGSGSGGSSGTTDGYAIGGQSPTGASYKTLIDKFSYSSDAGATGHSNLSVGRQSSSDNQV